MDYHKDFEELCALLNENGVEYLIVGGYAVAFHGAPRFTGDLDIFVAADEDNLGRMLLALRGFGFPTENLTPDYLRRQKNILELGRVPLQVHILTKISGVEWDMARESRVNGRYGQTEVGFIGYDMLIRNKRAAGRAKDLADIEALNTKS